MSYERVLSFDVGIKNLAFCLLHVPSQSIEKWECVDIGADKLDDIATNLYNVLDDMFLHSDHMHLHILIENQPVLKNPTMKSIQMLIYSYFKLLDVHGHCATKISFVSAGKKNTYLKDKGFPVKPKDYKSNKIQSIAFVNAWINDKNRSWCETLGKHKKQDDLCDALLQILATLAL